MEKSKLIKSNKIYRTYTLLFCAISFIIFAIFIKMNKSFIWNVDGFKQHYIIFYDFNQIIRNIFNNGFSMLSWNMGLGLDVIGQYSYYILGDPFAYISLLFPMEHLETVYSALIILRMYCVGIAFIAYCKYQRKNKVSTIVGTIVYTFCGFILYAGIRHPYFTNAAILLPLNFIGIEKLLRENKKTFLIFIVFISAVSNYYFFYMITIINFIYAILKYIFEYKRGIKDFCKKIFTIGICYLIGILMAGIILLPTIYAFFNSPRTRCEQTYSYAPNFYKYLWLGLVCMRFKNWSVIGVASIVILMIPVLFTKLKEKEAKIYASLFVVTTIILLIPTIASIMNGFSFPNNRWIFAYNFILSYITTICFDKKLKYSKKQLIVMTIVLAIYSFIGILITKLKIKSNLDFYASIGIATMILVILILNHIRKKSLKIFQKIILCLVILNIWIISFALYSSKGKGYTEEFLDNNSVMEKISTLDGKIDSFNEAIEYIKENDKGFYRIAKCDTSNQNTSLIYDYNSIQTYLSIGNGGVYNLSCNLEDNCYTATRCVNGMNRRTKITTLLATKYFICNKNEKSYVPYGYSLYKELNNTMIYINNYYLSPGIIYHSYISKEEYEKLSPLQKEDILLTSVVLEEDTDTAEKKENLIEKTEPIKILDYTNEKGEIEENKINISKKNQSIYLNIDKTEEDTEIYLSIKNLEYTSKDKSSAFKITASFNGIKGSEEVRDKISSAYYIENPNFLINLGVAENKTNQKLKITFNNIGTYTFDSLEILAVPMVEYEKKVDLLKIEEMKNIEYGNDYISGNINITSNGILQISTSYSEGWKAFVDGEEVNVIKVNEGLIGIPVYAGQHQITFKYKTPYINIGIITSILGFIGFIIVCIFDSKQSKNIKLSYNYLK